MGKLWLLVAAPATSAGILPINCWSMVSKYVLKSTTDVLVIADRSSIPIGFSLQKLAIFDINYCHSSIDRLLNEFPKKVIVFRKTDVTNRLEVQRSFKEISHKFNRIDIVINNAGVMDETDVNLTIDVNLVCIDEWIERASVCMIGGMVLCVRCESNV